jgi:hypothetical protein
MSSLTIDAPALSHLLASNVIDFLDLGCSTGKSYEYVRKATGLRLGISLDTDADKVAKCREVNDLSFVFDVTGLPASAGSVSSAYMIHFLEHLGDAEIAQRIILAALSVTRDFDHDAALATLGLKTYWSDWSGHRNRMQSSDFLDLDNNPLVERVRAFGIDRITRSDHPAILPASALQDQHDYDAQRHGTKPSADIAVPCFRELLVVLQRPTMTERGNVALARILSGLSARSEPLSAPSTSRAAA